MCQPVPQNLIHDNHAKNLIHCHIVPPKPQTQSAPKFMRQVNLLLCHVGPKRRSSGTLKHLRHLVLRFIFPDCTFSPHQHIPRKLPCTIDLALTPRMIQALWLWETEALNGACSSCMHIPVGSHGDLFEGIRFIRRPLTAKTRRLILIIDDRVVLERINMVVKAVEILCIGLIGLEWLCGVLIRRRLAVAPFQATSRS